MSQTEGWQIAVSTAVLILLVIGAICCIFFRTNKVAQAWIVRMICKCLAQFTAVQARPEPQFPNIEDYAADNHDFSAADDADDANYVNNGCGYSTELAVPPPSYDKALAMKRAESGDIVRFVVGLGEDAIVFEFSMPKNATDDSELKHFSDIDDHCPPPMYYGHNVSTQTLPAVDDCGSYNAELVTDLTTPAPENG